MYDSAIPLLDIYPKEITRPQKMCIRISSDFSHIAQK